MNRKRQAIFLFLLIAAAWSPRQLAAQPVPAGPETRVDTTRGDQSPSCPKIGVAPNHSFEIAWDYRGSFPSEIRGRHYNAAGGPTDPSEVVLAKLDYYPVVLDFKPVSNGFRALIEVIDDLGAPSRFYRQRTYPSGAPAGTPRRVGVTGTTHWVSSGPGDAVFAGTYDFTLHRLSMQKVDPMGVPAGTVYILNTRPILLQYYRPEIAPLAGGGWVAMFIGISPASPGVPERQVIRARLFNAAGAPLGPDFDITNIPSGEPGSEPSSALYEAIVAGGPGGGFAVSWHLFGEDDRLYLRFFKATGVPAGPESLVTSDHSVYPISAAFDGSGRLLLLWGATLNTPIFPPALRARLYKPSGIPAGPEFNPASTASGAFEQPFCGDLAWAGGSWLITWAAQKAGQPSAIFVRRFQ
jgi:hypothetical protein